MQGDESWRMSVHDEADGRYELQYDGEHAELFRFADQTYSLLLPAWVMDRLARAWRQMREMDKDV